jgi:hypothetical protein
MAPVTRGRGNRFAHLEDVNNHQEPVREEPPATYQAQSKVQFASLREQIAALTKLLSIESGRDRSRHIPSPPKSEEDDAIVEDEDGDPFVERRVHRHQPLVQVQANWWESGFKLNTPEFQSCVQPKEFMVAEKNKNIPPKEVPRKMAKMVPKEGAEIKHQSMSRYIGGTCQQFQRTCILGGKVAKLIIDPRSGMNIISEEAVRKLGLKTKSHPSPYQLEWLMKGNEVRVSKYCQVLFSIGAKYMDHVWCDVVDMTMCHLLLGKPWQDDKTAVYNETKNMYSFLLGKTKLTLLQSPWPKPQPSQGNTESVDEERQESEVIDEEFERECVEDVDLSQGFVDWDSPPTYDEDINEKDPIEEPLAFALEEEHEELGKQVDEVNLSESFALFDNNSTY